MNLNDRTNSADLSQPSLSFSNALFCFVEFLLVDLSIDISLIFLSGPFDGLVLLNFKINDSGCSNDLNPFFEFLIIER